MTAISRPPKKNAGPSPAFNRFSGGAKDLRTSSRSGRRRSAESDSLPRYRNLDNRCYHQTPTADAYQQIFDTEGKRRVIQQTPPTPAVPFRRRRNGFFTDNPLTFFIVARFWSFRRNFDGRPKLIRNLPVERGPVANQMDVTGRIKLASTSGMVPCPSWRRPAPRFHNSA